MTNVTVKLYLYDLRHRGYLKLLFHMPKREVSYTRLLYDTLTSIYNMHRILCSFLSWGVARPVWANVECGTISYEQTKIVPIDSLTQNTIKMNFYILVWGGAYSQYSSQGEYTVFLLASPKIIFPQYLYTLQLLFFFNNSNPSLSSNISAK